ncbi:MULTISPECIES: 1-acyl-sn-glycerol-3-phosphate acyltransferase [Brevibacterium]|uniref:Lysophospholipid acyltransferase family protein n=2 Tax=Bacteria TaxID=2 RepID=A0ABP8JCI1_9MICO|nr:MULTISPECIES: lysophospholipid acyltransferase family protein [Actinomycetes]MCK1802375.1 1-acyl-sn-glycerol-3-phosphate acyltransferase [Brevibacterium sp. R8603A2]MCX0277492.1 1-acyl-sn-glycerol-3-phosphate acyltransferase [Nocardia zapadnayensis]QCP06558.1 1-acyl-sn-glycerol-3-phosphate acyltransferase [Brevibacterium sp. CS2]
MFYWLLKTIVVGPVARALFRPWVRGLENIPETGGAIIAGNHLSFIDSIFVPLAVPRPVVYLAKNDYFVGRGIKGTVTRWFFKLTNQLPIDRSGGSASEASLDAGLRVLRRGDLLGIYPEGTRSPDGRLYRGRTGIARLVMEAGVPVVPVALIGTDKVQPEGRTIPRLRRVGIVFGKPLDFSEYAGMQGDRFLLRSVTDEIMYEILRLSGQEYVDTYASSVKTKLLTSTKPTNRTEETSGNAAGNAAGSGSVGGEAAGGAPATAAPR